MRAASPDCSTRRRRTSSAPSSPTSSARRAGIWCTIRWRCSRRRCWSAPISRSPRSRSPSFKPASGRGARVRRSICPAGRRPLIDESYNANPASMRAALALLGQAAGRRARAAHRRARRHAGTGAARSRRCIAASPSRSIAKAIDLVFCCGPLMRRSWEALPSSRRGGYAEDSAALEPQVLSGRAAPATSSWSRARSARAWRPIVKALQTLSVRRDAAKTASAQG